MATFTKKDPQMYAAAAMRERFPTLKYPRAFARIWQLLDSESHVIFALSDLDSEVSQVYTEAKSRASWVTKSMAMHQVLRDSEQRHDFSKEKVKFLVDGAIDSADKFFTLMRNRWAFCDPYVTKQHGAETHRIQWWIIARDIDNGGFQGCYEAKKAGELFQETDSLYQKDRPQGGGALWYQTCDNADMDTARRPEALKTFIEAHPQFSNILEAERGQMDWSLAAKVTCEEAIVLGKVKSMSVQQSMEKFV